MSVVVAPDPASEPVEDAGSALGVAAESGDVPAEPGHPERLRVLGPEDRAVPGEVVEAALGRALAAAEELARLDPADLDPGALSALAVGVERLRRRVDATAVRTAAHVDAAEPFVGDGFSCARVWLQHRVGLSGSEALRRVRAARLHRRCELWANAAAAGVVGVAQTELLARVVANPRISDETLARDRFELLQDAMDLPYREFERRARRWEMLADAAGAAGRAERQRAGRDVRIRRRPDGGWRLSGRLDDVAGAEVAEVFARFVDAEWRADWDAARRAVGDDADVGDLDRTQPQRHADALVAMARAAAVGGDPTRAVPTVNLLIDETTFAATVGGRPIEPTRYREVVCRTDAGVELWPADVVNTALWAHVRRVVHDGSGTVIDLGRRRRLFTGTAREAVLLSSTECVWVGCDRPVGWCDVDHAVGWAAHGPTVPRNGQPLCRRHHRYKERGYQVRRDPDGAWRTLHPDGHEIT